MVTESETAAVAPDTAVAEPETQPAETPPETASPLTAPETEAPLAPETPAAEPEAVESEPEPPAPESDEPTPLDLSDRSDEELESIPEVKSLLARQRESARRETEAQISSARQQHVSDGTAMSNLVKEATRAAENPNPEGAVELNAELVQREFNAVTTTALEIGRGQAFDVMREKLTDDFVTSAERQTVQDALNGNPVENPIPLYRATMAVHDRWVIEAATPEIEKRIRDEVTAELAATQANDAARDAEAARAIQPGATPTPPGAGAPTGGFTNRLQIETAHSVGEITSPQLKALKADGTWDRLPDR